MNRLCEAPEDVELYGSKTIRAINAWLRLVKLNLLNANRRENNAVKIWVGGHEIILKLIIKCVEVMIDTKLSFKRKLDYAREKAIKNTSSLARIMPNIAWPNYSRPGGRIHHAIHDSFSDGTIG